MSEWSFTRDRLLEERQYSKHYENDCNLLAILTDEYASATFWHSAFANATMNLRMYALSIATSVDCAWGGVYFDEEGVGGGGESPSP